MRIVGFGACMIKGYNLPEDKSFFSQFTKAYNSNGFNQVISLGGFPIDRACKYLAKKVLPLNPDFVIIQFGSTDSSINLKKHLNQLLKKTATDKKCNSVQTCATISCKYNLISKFRRWTKFILKFLLTHLLKTSPITSTKKYIDSMEYMINELINIDVVPIILSSFVHYDLLTSYIGKHNSMCIKKLQTKYNFIFVDCYSQLSKHDPLEILQPDGLHLSETGHKIVANAIEKEWINYANKKQA